MSSTKVKRLQREIKLTKIEGQQRRLSKRINAMKPAKSRRIRNPNDLMRAARAMARRTGVSYESAHRVLVNRLAGAPARLDT